MPSLILELTDKTDKKRLEQARKWFDDIYFFYNLSRDRYIFNKMMEKAKDTYWEPVFFLAYYTGLRSGELYALKWEDIDFDDNILHVNSSHNWKTKSEKTPKSGQARMVDISAPELKNFLLKHKKQNISAEPVYVFSRHNCKISPNRDHPISNVRDHAISCKRDHLISLKRDHPPEFAGGSFRIAS